MNSNKDLQRELMRSIPKEAFCPIEIVGKEEKVQPRGLIDLPFTLSSTMNISNIDECFSLTNIMEVRTLDNINQDIIANNIISYIVNLANKNLMADFVFNSRYAKYFEDKKYVIYRMTGSLITDTENSKKYGYSAIVNLNDIISRYIRSSGYSTKDLENKNLSGRINETKAIAHIIATQCVQYISNLYCSSIEHDINDIIYDKGYSSQYDIMKITNDDDYALFVKQYNLDPSSRESVGAFLKYIASFIIKNSLLLKTGPSIDKLLNELPFTNYYIYDDHIHYDLAHSANKKIADMPKCEPIPEDAYLDPLF